MPPLPRLAYLVAALALAALAVGTALLGRRRGAFGRAGVAITALAVLPLLYEGLVHAGFVRETFVRFGQPFALVLLAGLGTFLGWRLSRLPGHMTRARRALVILLSTVSAFAAALVVAEPELGRPLDRLTVIIAVDRSRSIDLVPGAEARVHAELQVAERGMRDGDLIGTVVFGAEAATEDPPRLRSELPPAQRVEVGRDATDLETAIRRALAGLPSDTAARVVLLTDGVETRGDALSAASAAVAADVPVDAVVLEQKTVADVRLVSVRAPSHANEGEPVDLRVVTSSGVATEIEVRVKRDGVLLHKSRVAIARGEDVLHLRETAADPGLHRYDVEVTAMDPAADGSPEDNAGAAFVRVRGPSLALVLEGDAGKAKPLADALEHSGFLVDTRTTSGVPADVGELAGFDLVVLSDIPASDLATTQIDAMASYARDLGGGLLLMGGDRSMGPGGYARTPIEEVSPVAFDLKQKKRRASLAEVIAIDFSGSMGMTVGKQTKLDLANEAAARSASLLGDGDRLGVEHVDTTVHWTVPMGPVTDTNKTGAAIRAVDVGGGGIYTDVALRAGYDVLAKEQVNLRHMLLFADGNDAEQIEGCRALVKGASAQGITTSVISLGRGHDSPELEVLSKIGGGRFYLIEDATKLPAVFTQETILAARSSIYEKPFAVTLGAPAPPTRAVDFGGAPDLFGYIVTEPKPRANVLLGGPEDDPVLATWSVGIGRAAAFASDYKDRWGRAWLGWSGAAKMFGQLARDTARRADDPRVRLESDASDGQLHVRADVKGDDGRAQSFRRLTVHVAGPDGFARDLPLEAVGAGRYAADVALSRPGTYVATAKDEVSSEAVGTTGAVLTAGDELRPTGSDRALLARIAEVTGGKLRDTLAGLYDDRGRRRFAYRALGPTLTLLAALAMLLAVGARRLGVPAFASVIAQRLRDRREAAERVRSERETQAAELRRLAAIEQERLNQALLARKRREHGPQQETARLGDLGSPRREPLFGRTGSPHTATATPTPPPVATTPTPPRAGGGAPPAQGERPLTAAEKLALKRRERR